MRKLYAKKVSNRRRGDETFFLRARAVDQKLIHFSLAILVRLPLSGARYCRLPVSSFLSFPFPVIIIMRLICLLLEFTLIYRRRNMPIFRPNYPPILSYLSLSNHSTISLSHSLTLSLPLLSVSTFYLSSLCEVNHAVLKANILVRLF